jgi:hypothetical protein
LDAGDPGYSGSLTTDQRGIGFGRIIGGRIDIGAVEGSLLTPYQLWAATRGLTAGVVDGFFDDPNGDGNPNISHFAIDADPLGFGGSEGKRRWAIAEVGGAVAPQGP